MKIFDKLMEKFFGQNKNKVLKKDSKKVENKKKVSGDSNKKTDSPTASKSGRAGDEFIKNLPPGVKIKRIEVGPKQIIRSIIYLVLFFLILSNLKNFLIYQVNDN